MGYKGDSQTPMNDCDESHCDGYLLHLFKRKSEILHFVEDFDSYQFSAV